MLSAAMFESGKWRVGRIDALAGAPVTVHWSVLLAALVIGGWPPSLLRALLALLMVLVHEAGHAAFVRWRGLRPLELQLHGFGGVCVHERGTAIDGAIIAWGGVLAQLVLLIPVGLLAPVLLSGTSLATDLVAVFVYANLWSALFNLMPIAPLDGARAWRLPGLLLRRRRKSRATAKRPWGMGPRYREGERAQKRFRVIRGDAEAEPDGSESNASERSSMGLRGRATTLAKSEAEVTRQAAQIAREALAAARGGREE